MVRSWTLELETFLADLPLTAVDANSTLGAEIKRESADS